MAWHQRHRLGLLHARLALAGGDPAAAAERASAVATDAAARGAGRYEFLARAVLGLADPSFPAEHLASVVEGLGGCAVLDGWPLVAALATARRSDPLRAEAERLAAVRGCSMRARTATPVRRFVDRVLTASPR